MYKSEHTQREESQGLLPPTCGAESYEGVSVPPDQLDAPAHRQAAQDVPHEVEGRHRGQVPLQGVQHQQLPVLKQTPRKLSMGCVYDSLTTSNECNKNLSAV